jgi:hypothetical protein
MAAVQVKRVKSQAVMTSVISKQAIHFFLEVKE